MMQQITELDNKHVLLNEAALEFEKLFTAAHAQQQALIEHVNKLSAIAQVMDLGVSARCVMLALSLSLCNRLALHALHHSHFGLWARCRNHARCCD